MKRPVCLECLTDPPRTFHNVCDRCATDYLRALSRRREAERRMVPVGDDG